MVAPGHDPCTHTKSMAKKSQPTELDPAQASRFCKWSIICSCPARSANLFDPRLAYLGGVPACSLYAAALRFHGPCRWSKTVRQLSCTKYSHLLLLEERKRKAVHVHSCRRRLHTQAADHAQMSMVFRFVLLCWRNCTHCYQRGCYQAIVETDK